jgi:hypothetical protein
MLQEQESTRDDPDPEKRVNWTPSKIIHRLGKEINNEESVCYWAYKNNIPMFCPALTDGSLGDMLYFHTFKSAPAQLRVDLVEDIRKINTIAVRAKRAGMIILGGGVVKHHIANACLMRNGAESAVYINTAQEFDGSDAGARPDEAVSWGKIKVGADSVKVCLFFLNAFLYLRLSLVFFISHLPSQPHNLAIHYHTKPSHTPPSTPSHHNNPKHPPHTTSLILTPLPFHRSTSKQPPASHSSSPQHLQKINRNPTIRDEATITFRDPTIIIRLTITTSRLKSNPNRRITQKQHPSPSYQNHYNPRPNLRPSRRRHSSRSYTPDPSYEKNE